VEPDLKNRGNVMKDMMSYKGYYGSVHYSDEDRVFHGKIEFVRSLVSYEGGDVEGLRKALTSIKL
jgi:predicted HicB family RNase H-like nuclease